MRTLARDMTKPILMAGGIGYLLVLAAALIWLHLSPEIVVAMTLGGIGCVIMALRPLVAIHVFIMLLNVETIVRTKEGVTGMKLLGGIILAGWLLSIAVQRRLALRMTGCLLAILLFLLWCGVSLIYAFDGEVALGRVLTFVQLAGATVMFSTVVDSPSKMRGVYWAIILWTLFSTIVALTQYYLGMTHVAVGLAGNRNLLATYIAVATVCAYLVLQTTTRALPRLLLASALPVFFVGLALTFSRGGLVAQVIGLVVVWYRLAREKGFAILTVSAAIVCAIALTLPEQFWNRAGSILPAIQRQEETFGMRVRLWKVALRMIEDRPIVGVGPANFMPVFHRYARGQMITSRANPHNSYVGVAAETGLVGLAIYLAIHLLALREAGRALRVGKGNPSRELESFAVAVEVSIVILMVASLTGDGQTLKILWFMFGLGLALGRMSLEAKTAPTLPQSTAVPTISPAIG
jgi:O-antigen ligase